MHQFQQGMMMQTAISQIMTYQFQPTSRLPLKAKAPRRFQTNLRGAR